MAAQPQGWDPNIPAAARVQNAAGAVAFTRYFIERPEGLSVSTVTDVSSRVARSLP